MSSFNLVSGTHSGELGLVLGNNLQQTDSRVPPGLCLLGCVPSLGPFPSSVGGVCDLLLADGTWQRASDIRNYMHMTILAKMVTHLASRVSLAALRKKNGHGRNIYIARS